MVPLKQRDGRRRLAKAPKPPTNNHTAPGSGTALTLRLAPLFTTASEMKLPVGASTLLTPKVLKKSTVTPFSEETSNRLTTKF